MAYKLQTLQTSNQSPRSNFGAASKPIGITIHHWGQDGQNHDAVVRWLRGRAGGVNNTNSSAHYVVSAGRVTQLAPETRATWHAGNRTGNGTTIGIEMRPEMSAGDWATLVELCVDIEKRHGSMKYYRHMDWKSTACPGRYKNRLGELVKAVNAAHKGKKPAATKPASTSAVSKSKGIVYTNRRNAQIYKGTGKNAKLDPQQPVAQNYKLAKLGTKGKSGSWTVVSWKGRKRYIPTVQVSTKKTPVIVRTNKDKVEFFSHRGKTRKSLGFAHNKGYRIALIETAGSWSRVRWSGQNAWIPTAHIDYA